MKRKLTALGVHTTLTIMPVKLHEPSAGVEKNNSRRFISPSDVYKRIPVYCEY